MLPLSIVNRWFAPGTSSPPPVLFFDGVCGLCNGFVQFLFRIDRGNVFMVATLQGDTARQRLDARLISDLDSLVVLTGRGETLTKSRAVLHVMNCVGGPWRVFYWATCWIPAVIADGVYDLVAKNRYRWFGKFDVCRIPAPHERDKFLD
ncbi:MAG: hypothetical protein RIQ81_1447 [Pseudomonadota bacterium]|jgi:predicted DCC family thiol-disulfide oxidoreductase YuxK